MIPPDSVELNNDYIKLWFSLFTLESCTLDVINYFFYFQINDPEEKRKVLEKREKNRIAAARARNRKKERTEELEEQESLLRSRIAATESDLERLRHLRHKLHVVSQEHEKLCQFLNQYR